MLIFNSLRHNLRDSAGIQTRNLLIRSQMLYSVKLRNLLKSGAKILLIFDCATLYGTFFKQKSLSCNSLNLNKCGLGQSGNLEAGSGGL